MYIFPNVRTDMIWQNKRRTGATFPQQACLTNTPCCRCCRPARHCVPEAVRNGRRRSTLTLTWLSPGSLPFPDRGFPAASGTFTPGPCSFPSCIESLLAGGGAAAALRENATEAWLLHPPAKTKYLDGGSIGDFVWFAWCARLFPGLGLQAPGR